MYFSALKTGTITETNALFAFFTLFLPYWLLLEFMAILYHKIEKKSSISTAFYAIRKDDEIQYLAVIYIIKYHKHYSQVFYLR